MDSVSKFLNLSRGQLGTLGISQPGLHLQQTALFITLSLGEIKHLVAFPRLPQTVYPSL